MRPKSKELKELQGTYEPSKENQLESIVFSQVVKFFSPRDWPHDAKVIFQDLCQTVRDGGHLTKAVYIGIRSLAFAEFNRRLAEKELVEKPTDSAWLKALDQHTKAVERGLAKFGLYPADLYRVPAKKAETKTLSLLK